MKGRVILFILVLLSGSVAPVPAKTHHSQRQETRTEPVRAFEEILDLWRDGKFNELYNRTIPSGKQTKESFIARLSSSERKPACCWEKLQEARVTLQDEWKSTLHATVGIESKDGSTEFITKQFKLQQEDGVWKVSMSDITSLAGSGKKKTRKHYTSKKEKTIRTD